LLRIVAYIHSFFLKRWKLENYPVRYKRGDGKPLGRLTSIPWQAQIDGWPLMSGNGASKAAAREDLRSNLESYQAANPLPRPGSNVPIAFAPTTESDAYEEFGQEFVRRIFGHEAVIFTDMSSLWDLTSDDTLDEAYDRIRIIYGVEVSDIEGANLVKVLARVSRRAL
jgi:hypothetical protein